MEVTASASPLKGLQDLSLGLWNVVKCVYFCRTSHGAAAANSSAQWQTLSGNAPLVISRGSFYGVFPESSQYAYQFALANSVENVFYIVTFN
ncbi:glycerophosphodiester phosphodiesterase GDPDL1-like isoform X2 [Zingiber officinale]|uniref:glycerophosphodiester phosphodiesterase GDPDL1-like isoform X2 n=1 Tax=Zingiber officinale TaxID=94328 RepID=UPI001C4B158A|nr:glycerophosphodiester phosphodiesterase GDPDL1-like isoform X2 [Zingiber officinale]